MGARKIRKEKTSEEKSTKKLPFYVYGIAAIVLAVGVYLVMKLFVLNPNRSAKKVSEAAFRAIYMDVDFKEFKDRTIFSDNCQKYLRMEVAWELAESEAKFAEMKGEVDFTMKVESVQTTEYKKGDEQFQKAVAMLLAMNPEADTGAIDRAALTTIGFSFRYDDETSWEKGTEKYWAFRVNGLWYCHPLLEEEPVVDYSVQ